MGSRRILLSSAIALALIGVAFDASAWCRSTTCRGDKCEQDDQGCPATGSKLFWPSSCVSFSFQKDGTVNLELSETRAAVMRAFQHWADIPCPSGGTASFTFTPTADVTCRKSEYNASGANVNVILFKDTDWTYRGIDGTLAKTSVTYNDQTGEIYDADIEVNAANNPLTVIDPPKNVKYDLEAIMTHEAGHFLGLAHSAEPDAVMYASYAPGSTSQRKLTPDDIDAICAVYPPDKKQTCNSDPRGGFSAFCYDEPKKGCSVSGGDSSTDISSLWPAALTAGALATALHRRRKRS